MSKYDSHWDSNQWFAAAAADKDFDCDTILRDT